MSKIQRYHTNEYGDLVKSNASYAKICKYEDVKHLERQLEEAREKLEGVKEFCYDFYSAGLSAGHPMTTAQSAERELKELEKELDQLKEQGDE